MLGGLRFGEILIILLVVVVFFGKDRLPNLGSSLGQAIRNFKRGFSGDEDAPPAAPSLSTGQPAAPASPDAQKVTAKQ